MDTIKDIVTGLMRDLKDQKSPRKNPDFFLKKALTKRELGHVKFRYLRKGVLGLAVDSSTWLYHLNLQKQKLLAKITKVKESPAIKDIRFCIGEIK